MITMRTVHTARRPSPVPTNRKFRQGERVRERTWRQLDQFVGTALSAAKFGGVPERPRGLVAVEKYGRREASVHSEL
jgi:hypothetical protein